MRRNELQRGGETLLVGGIAALMGTAFYGFSLSEDSIGSAFSALFGLMAWTFASAFSMAGLAIIGRETVRAWFRRS